MTYCKSCHSIRKIVWNGLCLECYYTEVLFKETDNHKGTNITRGVKTLQ